MPGPTFLSYTPNGRKLITVGANDALRVFETGSDGEPVLFDEAKEANLAVVASVRVFLPGGGVVGGDEIGDRGSR